MSRSIWSRRFSALSLWISSSRAGRLPCPGKACCPSWLSFANACFQFRNWFSPMPSDRAASAIDCPCWVTSLTASILNSRLKLRLFFAMLDLL
jgi:hypothetical protein